MGRGLQFLKLASQLGGAEIKKRLSTTGDIKTQLDQAKLLVESLGRLKGAAMKVGQLLSVEARDLLPPEVIAIFGSAARSRTTCWLFGHERCFAKRTW
jgi:predicted unusual protein kinase regulating ubiquinone biosynthesis (AarF/ABC1/UbiB family)